MTFTSAAHRVPSRRFASSNPFHQQAVLRLRVAASAILLLCAGAAQAAAPVATNVSISGTPEVGFQLTGSYTYSDADLDPESGTTFRWLRGGSPISGATATQYTLVPADQGALIVFEVTPGDGTVDSPGAAVQSSAVGPIAAANTAPVASNVSITGTTEVGFQLTGNYTYSDADGDPQGTSTFRWLRNGTAINGATSQTYLLVSADAGTQIRFEVTPVAQTGVSPGLAVQSSQVGPIAPANTPPVASNVNITGTTEVGFLLTGNYTYSDADGDLQGNSTYVWLRNNQPIPGATSQTYLLVAADAGRQIRFQVTPVAQTGVSPGSTVQSAQVGPIAPANTAPTATNVAISGTTEVGFQLTGTYTYNDADGDLQGASTFRWLRNGSPIPGATAQVYTLVGADQGTLIRFEVTPVAQTGVSPGLAVLSPQVGPIAAANTAPTATNVAISGTTEVGFQLTGSYTYSDADGDLQGATTFRWLRNGAAIPGATAQLYTLVAADEGTQIRFEVTPVAQTGVSPGTPVQSAPVGPIAPANTAPTATNVSISGTPQFGQVLTGNYTYNDADGDLEGATTFRWLRNGTAIPGATAQQYTVVAADVEKSLRFEVTPVATTGVTQGTPVQSGDLLISNTAPSITGQVTIEIQEDTSREIVLADLTISDLDDNNCQTTADCTLIVQDAANYTRSGANGNTITPALDFNGNLSVNVIVNDGFTNSVPFGVVVTVLPVNDAPTIIGVQAALTTPEDTPLTILVENLQIADPDNTFPGDFTLVLQDGLNYTRVDNTITPDPNYNGPLTVPATVSDLEPLSSPVFNLTVTVSSENDIPSADIPIGPQTAVENSQFTLDVSGNFSDADGDPLTFAASGLPGNPTFGIDPNTGVISGLPTIDDARDNDPYLVTVTVTDPLGAFVTDTFPLTVSALARANLALAIDVNSNMAAPAEDLRWTFSATNPVGPQAGQDVELVGRFVGAGLTVTPNPGTNCVVQPEVNMVTEFSCVLGALPVGATLSTVITTTTSQASEVVAFATAAGANNLPIDPNVDDNSAIEAAGVAEAFSVGAVQFLGTTSIRSVTAGDVNGDGRADIVVGTTAGQPVQVYLGAAPRESCQCPRDFSAVPIPLQDLGANDGVALGDFDSNGSLDLVVANGGGAADRVYFNDGTGGFSVANSASLGASFAQDVAVGDFNNDGRLDIAVAAVGGNPVYLGNGAGGFSLAATLGSANSHDVAAADFNGDNRDDLVFANIGGPSQVWLSSAGGGFTAGSTLNIGDAMAVAAGELNGAGGPDLVFGRVPTDVGDIPSNPVILNDGAGGFGAPAQLLGFSPTNDVVIGETNGDGLPDLVFINASGVHQIWTSSGGGFALHREQIIDGGARAGVLTDLGYTDNGNPGGNDLAMGGANLAGIGVYLNDGAGNLGRGDAVPPVLTLLGASSVSIDSGSTYSDAGATALDNIDGDISTRIVRVSTVNTAVVGNYSVTYNVSDFAGNPATQIVRSVAVVPAVGTGGGGGGSLSVALLLALCGCLVVAEALRRHRNRGVMIKIRIREDNRDE